jgi:hypothetical protein
MKIELTKKELDLLILAEATRRAEARGLHILKETRMRTSWTLGATTREMAEACARGDVAFEGAVVDIDED